MIYVIGNVFLFAAGIAAIAFPVMYLRSPWYESTVGRDTMTFAWAMVAVLSLAAISIFVDFSDLGRQLLRLVIYGTLGVVFSRRLWTLRKVQKDPAAVADKDAARRAKRNARKAAR